MSLVLYNDDYSEDGSHDFSIILDNRNKKTLVVHNKVTNEISLINNHYNNYSVFDDSDNDNSLYPLKCPHCGSILSPELSRGGGRKPNSEDHHDSFMHSNYFKLLESSIQSYPNNSSYSNTKHASSTLPDSIFTQGYYNKFFQEISLLGRGSHGSVYKVEHILNGVPLGEFALKKITIGQDPKWLLKVLHEVHMLVKISSNNANLVSYNHVWLEIDSINDFGPKVPCAFILQQYCSGGNLEDFVKMLKEPQLNLKQMKKFKSRTMKGRLLNNEEILIIFMQIVNGVMELHKNHIIHRDLKPSNCLLSKPYLEIPNLDADIENLPTILIGDFGESQLEGSKRNASGNTGTIEYCAPELIFQMDEFNKKTDIYSLGMILYFICFGELPFKSLNLDELKKEIGDFELKNDRIDLHYGFNELMRNLLSKESSIRMDTPEIFNRLNDISIDLKQNEKGRMLSVDDEQLTPTTSTIDIQEIEKDETLQICVKYAVPVLQVVLLKVLLSHDGISEALKYILVFLNGILLFRDGRLRQLMVITMIIMNTYEYMTTH